MSKKRALMKSVTWRITASITTLAIVRVVTGKWMIAGEVAVLEVLIKMFVYYFHERAWEKAQL